MMATARVEEHGGELRIRITADSVEDVFAEAARVVARQCGPTEGDLSEWERISLSARDLATLLADWINELIARSEIHERAYMEIADVRIRESSNHSSIDAEVRGKSVRAWRSPLKAATYHALELDHTSDRVRARVLIDV
jgi:SHS2 domain-containing protein